MAKHKFPDPNNCTPNNPAVFCPAERVFALYNDASGAPAQRMSKSVRTWFYGMAHEMGWAGVHFLPEVQSNHGAGCLLWTGNQGAPMLQQQSIRVDQKILIISDSDKDS